MGNDSQYFYLAYSNYGAVASSWGQTIYLDTDNNPATGWTSGLAIGADYVIQGQGLFQYTGPAPGTVWQWAAVTVLEGGSYDSSFEYRFKRADVGNPAEIKLAFVGSNEAYNVPGEDLYPDDVYLSTSQNRFLSYLVASNNGAGSAPVAASQSLFTNAGQALDITLSGSDADGDTLLYSLVTQPSNGVLTGSGSSLSYVPNAGFTGSDEFSFYVSDASNQSSPATIAITVVPDNGTGLPSNSVTSITLDGIADEWQNLSYFTPDPEDISGADKKADYLRAAMAHTDTTIFMTYETAGLGIGAIAEEWVFNVLLDTDKDQSTGYSAGLATGSDYLVQGRSLYQYNGTGNDWTWVYRGDTQRVLNGNVAELSIDRAVIGDPDSIDIVLIGENFSLGGTVNDMYPDGGYDSTAALRFLTYAVGTSGGNTASANTGGSTTGGSTTGVVTTGGSTTGGSTTGGSTTGGSTTDGGNTGNGNGGNTGATVVTTVTIEENEAGFCSGMGAVESQHRGYQGSGYYNTYNTTGAWIEWQVYAPQASNYEVEFRFANGSTNARSSTLRVNDANRSTYSFNRTGSWTSYTSMTQTVALDAGVNRLRLAATNRSGLPNMDYISLTGYSLTPDCGNDGLTFNAARVEPVAGGIDLLSNAIQPNVGVVSTGGSGGGRLQLQTLLFLLVLAGAGAVTRRTAVLHK